MWWKREVNKSVFPSWFQGKLQYCTSSSWEGIWLKPLTSSETWTLRCSQEHHLSDSGFVNFRFYLGDRKGKDGKWGSLGTLSSPSKGSKPTISLSIPEDRPSSWPWVAIPGASSQISPLHTWVVDTPLYNLPLLCHYFRVKGFVLWVRRCAACSVPSRS
jgi:hypothetical protein